MSRPPDITSKTVSQLLLKLYPFISVEESSVKQLVSYEDRNYYFRGVLEIEGETSSEEFVLKLFNDMSKQELVEGVNGVMRYLRSKDFRCSFPISSRNGVDVEVLSENQLIKGDPNVRAGSKPLHCVSVLSYIPGRILCDVLMTSELGYKVGELVGSMDALLKDFSHPVIDNRVFSDPIWDARNFLQVKDLLPSIENTELQRILKVVITDFETCVLPQIPSMSHGIVHYDTGGRNTVVQQIMDSDEFQVAGIIDFTDCICCPYVFELAILISDVLSVCEAADPVVDVSCVVAGYMHSFPLDQKDLDCLYCLVMARLCTVIVGTPLNSQGDKGISNKCTNDYHSKIVSECWKAIKELLKYSKEEVQRIWSEASKQTVHVE